MSFEHDKKKQTNQTNVNAGLKKLSKAFSPKDKLFLICSPLGGYSLLDNTKKEGGASKSSILIPRPVPKRIEGGLVPGQFFQDTRERVIGKWVERVLFFWLNFRIIGKRS